MVGCKNFACEKKIASKKFFHCLEMESIARAAKNFSSHRKSRFHHNDMKHREWAMDLDSQPMEKLQKCRQMKSLSIASKRKALPMPQKFFHLIDNRVSSTMTWKTRNGQWIWPVNQWKNMRGL